MNFGGDVRLMCWVVLRKEFQKINPLGSPAGVEVGMKIIYLNLSHVYTSQEYTPGKDKCITLSLSKVRRKVIV